LETYVDDNGVERTRTIFGQTEGYYSFWMPGVDWPHYRPTRPIFWKCSDPSAYVVRFWIENPFLGAVLEGEEKWENKLSGASFLQWVDSNQEWAERSGETYIWSTKYNLREFYVEGHVLKQFGTIHYINLENDERYISLRCPTDAYPAPYHTCRANVSWPDGLQLDIRFLEEAMPEWEVIIETAHDLAISWQENVK